MASKEKRDSREGKKARKTAKKTAKKAMAFWLKAQAKRQTQKLFKAAASGDAAGARRALGKGARRGIMARAALGTAADNGEPKAVKALIEAGAKLERRDYFGRTPLLLAAAEGGAKCAKALIRAGARLDARDLNGSTALALAAIERRDGARMVRLLTEAGADVDAANRKGWTPLAWAARMGKIATAQALLAAGASVDLANDDGQTPLMLALIRGQASLRDLPLVELLLEAGADADAESRKGLKALDYARAHRFEEAAALLSGTLAAREEAAALELSCPIPKAKAPPAALGAAPIAEPGPRRL